MAVEVKPTVGAHVGGYAHVDVNAMDGSWCFYIGRYKAWGSLLGMQLAERDITVACVDYRICNETCKETNLASLDAFSFQKSVFGSDFLEHVDDVSPKSNTSL
ncbi:hypothetical protein Bca4012_092874 [Brassica carinata]